MTNITIYDTEAEKLNELVEENLDDLVKEQSNERV